MWPVDVKVLQKDMKYDRTMMDRTASFYAQSNHISDAALPVYSGSRCESGGIMLYAVKSFFMPVMQM